MLVINFVELVVDQILKHSHHWFQYMDLVVQAVIVSKRIVDLPLVLHDSVCLYNPSHMVSSDLNTSSNVRIVSCTHNVYESVIIVGSTIFAFWWLPI